MTTNAAGFYVSIMALMMAMRGAPPMIGPSAIGAVNSALLLEDSVALANQARASVSDVQFLDGLGVSLEVRVETFTPKRAFDEPVDRLGRVGHLLRGGHHIWRGLHTRVLFGERAGRAVEELLSALEFGDRLVCE